MRYGVLKLSRSRQQEGARSEKHWNRSSQITTHSIEPVKYKGNQYVLKREKYDDNIFKLNKY